MTYATVRRGGLVVHILEYRENNSRTKSQSSCRKLDRGIITPGAQLGRGHRGAAPHREARAPVISAIAQAGAPRGHSRFARSENSSADGPIRFWSTYPATTPATLS